MSKTDPSAVPRGPQAPKGSVPSSLPQTPAPNYLYGIISHGDIDAELGKGIDSTNGYGGVLDGIYYYVIAGTSQADASVGQLFVSIASSTVDTAKTYRYYDLPGHGALTIKSASLSDIVVQGADGKQFTFDVTQGVFRP